MRAGRSRSNDQWWLRAWGWGCKKGERALPLPSVPGPLKSLHLLGEASWRLTALEGSIHKCPQRPAGVFVFLARLVSALIYALDQSCGAE